MDRQTIAINFSDSRDNDALFGVEAPMPSKRLAECAEHHRVEVPPALATLLTEHGAFAVYQVREDERYDGTAFLELFPRFRTLPGAVKDNFGTDEFFASELEAAEKTALETGYFCFGALFPGDQLIEYLYFDRQGSFGRLRYRDDDWLAAQGEAKALLTEATEPSGLDHLLSQTMDRAIALLLEYNEVYPD